MKKERNVYFDIVKAVSIILVIVGHCIQTGSGMEYKSYALFFDNPVFKFIYSFHMPLFMLISGYLFYFSCKKKKCYELLYSRFKQIIIPLMSWSVVSLLIYIFKSDISIINESLSFVLIVRKLLDYFLNGPWFLWAIWWCSLVIIIVRKLFKDNLIIYVFICFLTFILPDVLNFQLYKYMWPFFLIAYLFNKYNYKDKLKKIYLNKFFIFSCITIFMIMLSFFNYNIYIYTSGFTIINKEPLMQIYNNSFRFIIGIFGSISMMYLIYISMDKIPNSIIKIFSILGKNTLGIYIISGYIFDELLMKVTYYLPSVNYFYVLMESLCILCISFLINEILKKIKITNYLFLGGR